MNTRTQLDDPSVVLRSLGCNSSDKSPKTTCEKREFSKEELDDLYAKPMKRQKKESSEKDRQTSPYHTISYKKNSTLHSAPSIPYSTCLL